jgi:hypothetical protein
VKKALVNKIMGGELSTKSIDFSLLTVVDAF